MSYFCGLSLEAKIKRQGTVKSGAGKQLPVVKKRRKSPTDDYANRGTETTLGDLRSSKISKLSLSES